jgi:hypothetical protein
MRTKSHASVSEVCELVRGDEDRAPADANEERSCELDDRRLGTTDVGGLDCGGSRVGFLEATRGWLICKASLARSQSYVTVLRERDTETYDDGLALSSIQSGEFY